LQSQSLDLNHESVMSPSSRPGSLLESLVRIIVAEHRPEPRPERRVASSTAAPPAPSPNPPSDIVSRRDERGTGHSGDFPNPASDAYKGCF
jgi:hypothetical protein